MLLQRPEGMKITQIRRIFISKRKEVIGEWRKLHSESFKMCILHQVL
jgi:hypothetical protein